MLIGKMQSPEGVVPISRRIIAAYYDQRPLPPLSKDVLSLYSEIRLVTSALLEESPALPEEKLLIEEVRRDPVYKIERNLWKNREHIEEIMDLLDKSRWPAALQQPSTPEDTQLAEALPNMVAIFQKSLNILLPYQNLISKRAFDTVMTLLPRFFRETVVKQHNERELNWKVKYDDLVTSGASKSARYDLMWEQWMDLRRQLIRVASSICFCQTTTKENENCVMKVVPDFFPTINDDEWPMEEQGDCYGLQLYRLTTLILSIRLFLSLLWGRYDVNKIQWNQVNLLNKAVDVYACEFKRFIAFTSEVFEVSPFFISADVIGRGINYGFKERMISVGNTHEVSLQLDLINSNIAWEFFLVVPEGFQDDLNWDIEFSVECEDTAGKKTTIVPKKLCGADKAGNHKLIWNHKLIGNNSLSLFLNKYLCYKVECTPPVVEPEDSTHRIKKRTE